MPNVWESRILSHIGEININLLKYLWAYLSEGCLDFFIKINSPKTSGLTDRFAESPDLEMEKWRASKRKNREARGKEKERNPESRKKKLGRKSKREQGEEERSKKWNETHGKLNLPSFFSYHLGHLEAATNSSTRSFS